jgi:hypothetical protein
VVRGSGKRAVTGQEFDVCAFFQEQGEDNSGKAATEGTSLRANPSCCSKWRQVPLLVSHHQHLLGSLLFGQSMRQRDGAHVLMKAGDGMRPS